MERSPTYLPFVKAAQYLANISADQDFYRELCNVMVSFFKVAAVAVAEKNLDGSVTMVGEEHICNELRWRQTVGENVLDVLDTGIFKEAELDGAQKMTLFFIPIEVEKKTAAVLILGHNIIDPSAMIILLNEYLAVARLAGTIQSRINYEREAIRRTSNEKFRLLFNNARDPILILDESGYILECNEAAIEMRGAKTKEQLLMRKPSEFAPECQPDGQLSSDKAAKWLREVLEKGDVRFEWVVQRYDGSELILDAKLRTILLDGTKILVQCRDITERKRSEGQLKYLNTILQHKMVELQDVNAALEEEIMERQALQEQLNQYTLELTETNKELKDFANIVAHDFRTPMVNLKGFSQELSHSLADLKQIIHDKLSHFPAQTQQEVAELLERDVPEALTFIHSAVDRLDRMIAALLGLARLGRREIFYQEIDMHEIVTAVLQSFYHQIEQKNIHLEIGSMPHIKSDQLAMEQIISNLLDNAIKYLDPDRPGTISLDCTDNGDEHIFSVQDNGRGIAGTDRDKIFEIFRRSGMPNVPGEGMGLACVRTLIRQLGGRVWCESELGSGTQIHFTIPKSPVRSGTAGH